MERNTMRWVLGLYVFALSAGAGMTRAQDFPAPSQAPGQAAPAATPQAAPEAPPPVAPPAPTTPPQAGPSLAALDPNAACMLGVHEGIAPPDARTSAILVCEALRNAGAHVETQLSTEAQAASHASAYRVELRPLGYIIVLAVHYEAPVGRPVRSRNLQLGSIEEVPVAAPRIAESFIQGTPIQQTAKVNTLVGQETRSYQKEFGETLFSVGVLGFALPGDTWAGYGVAARLYYEAARYSVGLDLRVGGSAGGDGHASLIGLAAGARYFFNEHDISPFAGGGLGIMWLGLDRRNAAGSLSLQVDGLDGSGLEAFGEVGVEFLRLHKTRFDILLRVDAPFFRVQNDIEARYTMPVGLMASYSFN